MDYTESPEGQDALEEAERDHIEVERNSDAPRLGVPQDEQLRGIAAEIVLHVRRGAWHTTEVQQFLRDMLARRLGAGGPQPNQRLRELATVTVREKHDSLRGFYLGHTDDFDTCTHSDCVLVRAGGPQEKEHDH